MGLVLLALTPILPLTFWWMWRDSYRSRWVTHRNPIRVSTVQPGRLTVDTDHKGLVL